MKHGIYIVFIGFFMTPFFNFAQINHSTDHAKCIKMLHSVIAARTQISVQKDSIYIIESTTTTGHSFFPKPKYPESRVKKKADTTKPKTGILSKMRNKKAPRGVRGPSYTSFNFDAISSSNLTFHYLADDTWQLTIQFKDTTTQIKAIWQNFSCLPSQTGNYGAKSEHTICWSGEKFIIVNLKSKLENNIASLQVQDVRFTGDFIKKDDGEKLRKNTFYTLQHRLKLIFEKDFLSAMNKVFQKI